MATAADILGLSQISKVPVRWSEHYEQLCAERDRLLERDCTACETSRVKLDDLTEAASEESQNNLSLVAASATQETIFEVLAAIARIERGTYGVCEITGQPIEAERLRAIPWARYSYEGQHELERSGQARRPGLPALQSLLEPEPGSDDSDEDEAD